jgi:hypothetical protein
MPDDLFAWADGAALRDSGMAIAGEAQERCAPGWAERAYQAIVAVARFRPEVHVDDVLLIFREQPEHPNAWGAVWSRAIRDHIISRTGVMRETNDRRKHRHRYPVYASQICGGSQ